MISLAIATSLSMAIIILLLVKILKDKKSELENRKILQDGINTILKDGKNGNEE